MPAPVGKFFDCRMFFRDAAGVGYSEVWTTHLEPPDPTTLATRLTDLVTARLQFLNENTAIIYASASDVGIPGDVTVLEPGLPRMGGVAEAAVPASVAAHFRVKAEGPQWITRLFRGISDNDIIDGDNIDPAGDIATSLPFFMTTVTTGVFGVLHRVATARFLQWSFQPYTGDVIPRRISHRDAGRPFGERVGRRA